MPRPPAGMKLAAIVLAAGKSTRLPRFKPLLRLGGLTLLARAAGLLRQAGLDEIVAVSGHRADEVQAEAGALGLCPVFNANFEAGMFSSVRAGLQALPDGLDGAFMLPVDIPLLRPATLRTLAERFRQTGAEALLPTFQGQPGHPPLIAASSFPQILAWDGAGGLARALATLRCERLPVADQEILYDIDDEAALSGAEARLARLPEPSPAEALALLELHGVGERGLAHGRGVAEAALLLARALNARGAGLDLELIEAAALLHDIAKGQPRHEQAGARLLDGLGFPRTAGIVAAHRDIDPAQVERLGERELVYLADKLVRGPERIGVARRFQEKLERFGQDPEAMRAIRQRLAHARAMLALVERAAGQSLAEMLEGRGCDPGPRQEA